MTQTCGQTDDGLRDILQDVHTIAVLGFSAKPSRPSHAVAAYLADVGYRVLPVNPGLAGRYFFGEVAVARLADVTVPIDMVDVFRRSEFVPQVVDDILRVAPRPKVMWTQIGVRDDAAAARARAVGVAVVQNRCPRIEIPRLFAPGWRRA